MKIHIIITNDNEERVFSAVKPTVDLAIEELGRFERLEKQYRIPEEGVYLNK